MTRTSRLPREPIRQLPDGRYRAVLTSTPRGAPRKQATKTFTDLSEARSWVAEVRAEAAQGGYQRPLPLDVETVEALATRWLRRDDVRTNTMQAYRHALQPVLRRLGDRDLATVTVRDARELTAWLSSSGSRNSGPLSPRSVRASLGAAAQAFDWPLAEGGIAANPFRSSAVKAPRQPRTNVPHWTPVELRRFVEVGDADPWAPVWRLVACGLTRADACGLRWTDFDLDAGLVSVSQGRVQLDRGTATDEPKSPARSRTIPVDLLWPGTSGLLRAMRARQCSVWVLVDATGRPVRPNLVSERFQALSRRAGLPPIRLHAVRHSLAALGHAQGVSPADMAALEGHSVQIHLANYLPASGTAGIAAAADVLGARLGRIAL